jgi:hypothetical protein
VRSLARELEVAMGLPVGGYNRAEVTRYLETHQPERAPEEHEEFLVAIHRFIYLGTKYFGYAPRPAEEAAAAAGAAVTESGAAPAH